MQNSIDAQAEFEVLAVRKLCQLSDLKARLRPVFSCLVSIRTGSINEKLEGLLDISRNGI